MKNEDDLNFTGKMKTKILLRFQLNKFNWMELMVFYVVSIIKNIFIRCVSYKE